MSKNRWVARFAARSGDSRSAIWRCFQPSNRDDVYLGTRATLTAIKASFHATGEWHVAFSHPYFAQKRDEGFLEGERWLKRWHRPESPVAVVFRVILPSISVVTPVQPLEETKDVTWIAAPPVPNAVHVALVMVRAEAPDPTVPEGHLVSRAEFPCGDRLLLVQVTGGVPELNLSLQGPPKPLVDPMPDLRELAGSNGLRAIVPGEADDGVPFFMDVAVARKEELG